MITPLPPKKRNKKNYTIGLVKVRFCSSKEAINMFFGLNASFLKCLPKV